MPHDTNSVKRIPRFLRMFYLQPKKTAYGVNKDKLHSHLSIGEQ